MEQRRNFQLAAESGNWNGVVMKTESLDSDGKDAKPVCTVERNLIPEDLWPLLKAAWIEPNGEKIKAWPENNPVLVIWMLSTPGVQQMDDTYFGLFENLQAVNVLGETVGFMDPMSGLCGAQWCLSIPVQAPYLPGVLAQQITLLLERHKLELDRVLGELEK